MGKWTYLLLLFVLNAEKAALYRPADFRQACQYCTTGGCFFKICFVGVTDSPYIPIQPFSLCDYCKQNNLPCVAWACLSGQRNIPRQDCPFCNSLYFNTRDYVNCIYNMHHYGICPIKRQCFCNYFYQSHVSVDYNRCVYTYCSRLRPHSIPEVHKSY